MVAKLKKFKVPGTDITLVGGPKLASAVKELKELDLYQVGKITHLIKAAYAKGKIDGTREVTADVVNALRKHPSVKVDGRGALRDGQLTFFGRRSKLFSN